MLCPLQQLRSDYVSTGSDLSQCMTKPTKWHVQPAKIQISLGICPVWSESSLSAWRKARAPSYPLSAQRRLIRLGGCPGWSESSLGTHAILLVLSCTGSSVFAEHSLASKSWQLLQTDSIDRKVLMVFLFVQKISSSKTENFQIQKLLIFFIFLFKT